MAGTEEAVRLGIGKLRELTFGSGRLLPTLAGTENFTIRRFRKGVHDFKKGEVIWGVFKDGLDVQLSIPRDAIIAPFRNLLAAGKDQDKNGYYFDQEYFASLSKFYSNLSWDYIGATIFYEVLKIGGTAVTRTNKDEDFLSV